MEDSKDKSKDLLIVRTLGDTFVGYKVSYTPQELHISDTAIFTDVDEGVVLRFDPLSEDNSIQWRNIISVGKPSQYLIDSFNEMIKKRELRDMVQDLIPQQPLTYSIH